MLLGALAGLAVLMLVGVLELGAAVLAGAAAAEASELEPEPLDPTRGRSAPPPPMPLIPAEPDAWTCTIEEIAPVAPSANSPDAKDCVGSRPNQDQWLGQSDGGTTEDMGKVHSQRRLYHQPR